MSTSAEYLLTACESAQQWSACLWDFTAESGNILQVFRNGGVVSSKTLAQIGNDYFIGAEKGKPLLHVWPVNSQEHLKNIRLVLPETASTLTVSPDNSYLAAGINLKLYVWHISSGKLLVVQQKHLLPITCVKFSADGDYLVTACQAGVLMVYNFGNLISLNTSQAQESGQQALYMHKHHTDAITDIYVGKFGSKARVASVSSDHTCKLYELHTGQLLLNFVSDDPLTHVILDAPCWNIFMGTTSGTIKQYALHNPPRTVSLHDSEDKKINFIGHKDRISALTLNISNDILASGSCDGFVIIWSIASLQMLNKIEHRAAVTNVQFVLRNKNLFAQTLKPTHVLKTLQRSIDATLDEFTVSVIQHDDIEFSDDEQSASGKYELEDELLKAKTINKQLYNTLLQYNEKLNVN